MKKLFLLLTCLSIIGLQRINAAAVENPAAGYYNSQKKLVSENPGAFFALLEAFEAYYRAQAVLNDLESVHRYFEALGFDTRYLYGIKGKVEEKVKTLKEVKSYFKTPKEQTKPE